VFAGVGGGLTKGPRVINLATSAENQGAFGVVLNGPTPDASIRAVNEHVDIPIVVTVVNRDTDYAARIAAGADIFNVSAAAETPAIVREIRAQFPDYFGRSRHIRLDPHALILFVLQKTADQFRNKV
jgi:hypothetical protein